MSFWFSPPKCPVDAESRGWVDERMEWLAGQFGLHTWRMARAVEPTDDFFPDKYDGTEAAARNMLHRICSLMGVHPNRIELRLYTEDRTRPVGRTTFLETKGIGTAGQYRVEEKEIVAIETSNLGDPMALVATMAHELAHVRLLGEKRVSGEEEDHEPLTDLATVFFGLGLFAANSTFRYTQWAREGWHGWKASRLGYLDEMMLGYALGLWTTVRGEENPGWIRHLRPNPKAYTRQTIRFLKANPPAAFKA